MEYKRPASVLATIKQQNGESLKSYMDPFEAEALLSNNRSDKVFLVLLIAGLRERIDFWMEVQKQDIRTLKAFHKLANGGRARELHRACKIYERYGIVEKEGLLAQIAQPSEEQKGPQVQEPETQQGRANCQVYLLLLAQYSPRRHLFDQQIPLRLWQASEGERGSKQEGPKEMLQVQQRHRPYNQ